MTAPSAAPDPDARRLVLVAGAGRSGTSTMAGLLRILGLHVPQPEVIADESNPKGFGEPRWVVDLHERLLGSCGVQVADARPQAWEDARAAASEPEVRATLGRWLEGQFTGHRALVVKDPRLSWFLPLWQDATSTAGAQIGYVTMLRAPAEVIGSRQTYYNGLGPTHLAASWLNVMLHTEAGTRGRRAFVRYDDLLADWRPALACADAALGLGLRFTPEQVAAAEEFVDPGLRRHSASLDDLDLPAALRDLVDRSWDTLSSLTDPAADSPATHAVLDSLREEFVVMYRQAEALSTSSVIAARRKPRTQGRPAAAPAQVRAADRIPHSVRAMVPAPLRRGLRRVLGRPR